MIGSLRFTPSTISAAFKVSRPAFGENKPLDGSDELNNNNNENPHGLNLDGFTETDFTPSPLSPTGNVALDALIISRVKKGSYGEATALHDSNKPFSEKMAIARQLKKDYDRIVRNKL